MAKNNVYTLGFKRKRKGLTNYRMRLKILSSSRPRLIVRKSLRNTFAFIGVYHKNGDIIKVSVHSKSLEKLGWPLGTGNLPSAYLVGYLAGKKALNAEINDAILDIGLQKSIKGSRIYAVVAGAIDAGLKIPCNKDILPSQERISGRHIAAYSNIVKSNSEGKQFSGYTKKNIDPKYIEKIFEDVKAKIGRSFD